MTSLIFEKFSDIILGVVAKIVKISERNPTTLINNSKKGCVVLDW